MRVYFAAPLFNEAERTFNERVCTRLEDEGHSVFLPQRDGFESMDAVFDESDVETEADALQSIFEKDRDEVLNADLLIAVLDGQVPDEGVAVEMGIAHENDVPVLGLKTGRRIFAEGEPLNAMLFGILDDTCEDVDEFVERVNEYE